MKLSFLALPMERLLWNWEENPTWRLLLPEGAILIPEFTFTKCTKIPIQGKMCTIPIIPADFRPWRKNWSAMELSLIFCLNLRQPATVRLLIRNAVIRWTESVQFPPGSCFGKIRAPLCKGGRVTIKFLPGSCFFQIRALLCKRSKESKHIFTPCLTGAAVPKAYSMTSGGVYLA